LHNPFFRKNKSGRNWLRFRFLAMGAPAAVLALVWFLMFSAFWRWDQVTIEGLTRLPASELEKIVWEQGSQPRWLMWQQSNIFAFDAEALAQNIAAHYNFAGLTVHKSWPRSIVLTVSERPYAFIWQEGSEMFYASADGYAIKEPAVSEEDKKKYPIFDNQTGQTMIGSRNKIGIKDEYLRFFLDLHSAFSSENSVSVEKFVLDREFNTLRVKLIDGPLVYFNTKSSAREQLNNLILVKNAKIKDNFNKTNYVDLRYGDKIFIHPEFNN
jgi:hypothetical protein